MGWGGGGGVEEVWRSVEKCGVVGEEVERWRGGDWTTLHVPHAIHDAIPASLRTSSCGHDHGLVSLEMLVLDCRASL